MECPTHKASVKVHFDNGDEYYCEVCEWETWVPNPDHPNQDPNIRELSMKIGYKKLIPAGRRY